MSDEYTTRVFIVVATEKEVCHIELGLDDLELIEEAVGLAYENFSESGHPITRDFYELKRMLEVITGRL